MFDLIIIYFLAFLPSVCLHPSCHSRWTYGPEFWYGSGFWWPLADFWKIEVKGQGQKSIKNMPFLGRFWSQRLSMCPIRTNEGQEGYLCYQHNGYMFLHNTFSLRTLLCKSEWDYDVTPWCVTWRHMTSFVITKRLCPICTGHTTKPSTKPFKMATLTFDLRPWPSNLFEILSKAMSLPNLRSVV